MVFAAGLLLTVFIIGAVSKDTWVLIIAMAIVALLTFQAANYECQLVIATSTGSCQDLTTTLGYVEVNMVGTIAVWFLAFPVRRALGTMVKR